MHAMLITLALSGAFAQEGNEVSAGLKAAANRGFEVVIRAMATAPGHLDGAEALSGAPIRGTYSNGVFHATDGLYEIWRSGDRVTVLTPDGWRPVDRVIAALRGEIEAGYDRTDGSFFERGNLTRARQARRRLIRLLQLLHRTDITQMLALGSAFGAGLHVRETKVDGTPGAVVQADLTVDGAFALLEGPFQNLVASGELAFTNVSAAGRAEMREGVMRKLHLKARAKYVHHDETERTSRRGAVAFELAAEFTELGRATVEVPAEAKRLLEVSAQ